MASPTASALRRAIRSVAGADSSGLTDRELLLRFVEKDDQAAFTALVNRHSGMLLGVCRRALPTVQDAEDACQATFLLLARKANAGRWQPSVANWLYATARKVARNALVAAQRRARREAKAGVREVVEPIDRMSGRELLAALDTELENLPSSYREPLVLCYLEGLTHDEAAARLAISATTLKVRIHRGRKRLHEALTKGGITLGAGLLAVAATSPAGGSPPRLAQSVLAAASGKPSPAVAALAEGVAVNGLFPRMKLAALAAVGAVVIGLGFAVLSPIAAEPPKPAAPKADPPAKPNDRPNPEAKERTITGRVLAADGEPIVAELFVNWIEGKRQPLGKTKADGTFAVTVPVGRLGWLATRADEHGIEFVGVRAENLTDITLQLPKEQPIRGRVIDPEGKPLAGVRVTADSLTCYDNNSHEKHLKKWADEFYAHGIPPGGDRGMWFRSDRPGDRERESPTFTTTDADGKFELGGVGADQQVGLTLRGNGLALTHVSVMNRHGFDPKPYIEAAGEAAKLVPGRRGRYSQLYGPTPLLIVERGKVVRGTATALDTGKPLAGMLVFVQFGEQLAHPSIFEGVTGNDGRFEVHGVRKHDGYSVECRPDAGTGYFSGLARVEDTAGYEPITVDLKCARGVIVTGTLRDKATGKPLSGRVWRTEVPGNPFAKDYPAHTLKDEVKVEGTFRFVTIPGPVLVGAGTYKGKDGQVYRKVKPDPKCLGEFRSVADASWYKVIEAKESDREIKLDIELEPAPQMAVKVVDAGGKPVTGAHATGITHLDYNRPVHHPGTDTLTVFNLESNEERLLAVLHVNRKLVGTRVVKADEKDPVVQLGPGGTVTGRIVGADGKPIAGMKVKLYFTSREVGEVSDLLTTEEDVSLHMPRRQTLTDANGEFRIDTLFPGCEFRLTFMKGNKFYGPDYGKAARHTIASHGDTLKLGDLRLELNEHNEQE
jgi:RNA polymerase sigma factor (sigma-70 family)